MCKHWERTSSLQFDTGFWRLVGFGLVQRDGFTSRLFCDRPVIVGGPYIRLCFIFGLGVPYHPIFDQRKTQKVWSTRKTIHEQTIEKGQTARWRNIRDRFGHSQWNTLNSGKHQGEVLTLNCSANCTSELLPQCGPVREETSNLTVTFSAASQSDKWILGGFHVELILPKIPCCLACNHLLSNWRRSKVAHVIVFSHLLLSHAVAVLLPGTCKTSVRQPSPILQDIARRQQPVSCQAGCLE